MIGPSSVVRGPLLGDAMGEDIDNKQLTTDNKPWTLPHALQ